MKRIYDRLMAEHDMRGVSYQVVRAYVAHRKPKIRVEAGRGPVNVFFPQSHRPAAEAEAEVDFGEVTVNLRGELVTCMLFAFRLSYSGKAVHRVFISGGQEAFLEGHVHAFTTLGGVPTGKIRYDNLRSVYSAPVALTCKICGDTVECQVLSVLAARLRWVLWIALTIAGLAGIAGGIARLIRAGASDSTGHTMLLVGLFTALAFMMFG